MHEIFHWLLANGVGQNITAGGITLIVGWMWSKTRWWPLGVLHDLKESHEALHQSHQAIHEKLDSLQERHTELQQTLKNQH